MKQYKVVVEFIFDAENMDELLDKVHMAINPTCIHESVYAQQITEITKHKSLEDILKDDCLIKGLKRD